MRKKAILILLAPIPALCMGAMVMQRNAISPAIYLQNIVCYAVLALVLLFLRNHTATRRYSSPAVIAALVAACVLLALTFLDRGLDGVHRWLSIGSFRLYISSIVLPSVVFLISKLWQDQKERVAMAVMFMILYMLLAQPDAAQLSAFVAAMCFLVLMHAKSKVIKYALVFGLTGCFDYGWRYIDGLEAVPHVEGILQLAGELGIGYYVLGIFSLGILLLPFLCFSNAPIKAKAVGIYYLVMIGATFFGHFPVPFMGYGVSPVVGYMIVIVLLMREDAIAPQCG